MKKIQTLKSFGLSLAALALAGFLNSAQAQFTPNVDSWTNAFDTSGSTTSWFSWYNWTWGVSWNASVYNPATAGNAGSLEIDDASPWTQPVTQQGILVGSFGPGGTYDRSVTINANLYTNIIFDVLVSSNCVVNPNGNFGGYYVGFISGAGNTMVQVGFVPMPAAASNNWVHCVLPIPKTLVGDISAAWGLYFQSTHWWDQDPSEPPAGGLTNYIDNLEVQITPGPPPPPPSLLPATIQTAVPGVNLIATGAATGNRYDIITTNTVGYGPRAGHTVTYTWNITKFANDPNGFMGLFMLSCGADSSLTPNSNGGPGPYDSAIDWNWGNVIVASIQENSGSAYMNFRYKTNAPAANGSIWTTVCTVSASSAIGQWSVSIDQDSGLVTLTSPQNTTNFTMDAASLALFTDPLALTLAAEANDSGGLGQSVVFSNFTATGCATPISDNFATDMTLNTNIWFALAVDLNGIQLVPPTAGVLVGWTRPDSGYIPEVSSNLLAGFAPVTPIATFIDQGNRMAIIPQAPLGPNANFFRLLKRVYSQLQILLPGETAAPNTPSGKTGTPSAQSANVAFNVIVNSVDANWNVVSGSTDAIAFTSSDSGNFLVVSDPTQPSLSGGTITATVEFLADGSATITASDATDGSKTADTSPTVTY